MFSIETYDEVNDHSKTVLAEANDEAKKTVILSGIVCVVLVEFFVRGDWNHIGSWFLRAVYILGILFYYHRSSTDDENTIFATDKGLYFAIQENQHGVENQFLLLEWSDVICCEYYSERFLRLKTKLERKNRHNYTYEGVKLLDLKLRSAEIRTEIFQSYITINLDMGRASDWSKLTKIHPIRFINDY